MDGLVAAVGGVGAAPWNTENHTPKHSSISATIESQSSIYGMVSQNLIVDFGSPFDL